jgi:hypothetical protein
MSVNLSIKDVSEPRADRRADCTHTSAELVPPADPGRDDLLAELDAVVAGSRWGHDSLLTREQAHDRRLQRGLDDDAWLTQAGGGP